MDILSHRTTAQIVQAVWYLSASAAVAKFVSDRHPNSGDAISVVDKQIQRLVQDPVE